MRYYHPDVRWLGIEPAARGRELVRQEAARLGRRVLVLPGRAERLELADASVDAVVGSFVLCSVTDQAAVLAELHRVLRQHGRYLFAEHVAAPPSRTLPARPSRKDGTPHDTPCVNLRSPCSAGACVSRVAINRT